jgi:molybdopterin molybdotransferase
MTLSFDRALETVKERVQAAGSVSPTERAPLAESCGRVLAEDVRADRDYPPFHRATRDGYALRSADLSAVPCQLALIGEVRAGQHFRGVVARGQCVEIMTGAPLPEGADAVVMVEDTSLRGAQVEVRRGVAGWENTVQKGSEARAGTVVVKRGRVLGAAEAGLLASVGCSDVSVFEKPSVAILPTGDELVDVEASPEWYQVRNSNAVTLEAQVRSAGGSPKVLPVARDDYSALRELIEQGFREDLLLLSGGVSAGKYDLVKRVLAEFGAEFFIEGVAIRPGKPLTFGCARGRFFFGLPGNPVSTYVTFELFARNAIRMLGGAEFECPTFLRARLARPRRQKLGLTAFLPARVWMEGSEPTVDVVGWQGSGDLVGVTSANCFMVIRPEQAELSAGEWVDVLPRNF